MRGVVFTGDRQLELREFPDPTPGPGEVVLEIKASGMCGSDLQVLPRGRQRGRVARPGGQRKRVIGGHEPCGVVAARGPGVTEAEARVGQRVMIHHYAAAGSASTAGSGWSQLCPSGITVYGVTGDGGHARYMKVPARTIVPLPDELTFEEGAAVSCGTGTAYGALKRLDVSGRDTLADLRPGPGRPLRHDAGRRDGRPRHRAWTSGRAPRPGPRVRRRRGGDSREADPVRRSGS